MGKLKYAVTGVVIAFIVVSGLFLLLKKDDLKLPPNTKTGAVSETEEQDSPSELVQEPVKVSFLEESISLNKNQKHTASLSFDTLPDPAPTAITLNLSFDPQNVKVENIEVGNLWTGTNVLQKDIDNENGKIAFSAGQGFDDEITGNTVMAKVTITPLSENVNVEIEIDADSAYASVQEKKLIYLQGLPLSVSVE